MAATDPPVSLDLSVVGGRSLASAAVVERLVREFYWRVLRANDEADVKATVDVFADIFGGVDQRFTGAPDAQAQQAIGQRLELDSGLFAPELFRQAFSWFAAEAFTIVRDESDEGEMDNLIRYTTAVLLGAASALYPGGLGWKDGPYKGDGLA